MTYEEFKSSMKNEIVKEFLLNLPNELILEWLEFNWEEVTIEFKDKLVIISKTR